MAAKIQFDPASLRVGTANIPERVKIDGTNRPIYGYAFANDDYAFVDFKASDYGSGNLTLVIDWYSRSGSTSGNVQWGAALMAVTPGDAQSMETDAFATATNTTTTVNGTARGPTRTSITISNLDSLAADDDCCIKITRNSASTMTGDAIPFAIELQYS